MIPRLWRLLGWIGVVFTLVVSLVPPVLDEGSGHTDKFVHLAGYGVLMFWWAQLAVSGRWRLALAVIAYGLVLEGLQGLTPNRSPDALDALANTGGVLLGWLAARNLPNLPAQLTAFFALRR